MKKVKCWIVLFTLLMMFVAAGCSGITPNQMAPSQNAGKYDGNGSKYKYPEHDFDDVVMD